MRGIGPIPSDIFILGEAPGAEEEQTGTPFVGPSGALLNNLLSKLGISRSSCFISNVARERPPGNDIGEWIVDRKTCPDPSWVFWKGKWVHPIVRRGIDILERELAEVRPKIVIALGNTPLWALTGNTGIAKWRGSRLSPPETEFTVLPTYHPAAALREENLKSIILMDLRRAKAIYEGTQTPRLYKFKIAPSFSEVVDYLTSLVERGKRENFTLAADVETEFGHIICLGIADSADTAICIPFFEENSINPFYWSLDEEATIVHLVIQLFKNPRICWVGQNFLYDCQYFYRFWCAWPVNVADTMIGAHSIYSNMRKGLAFLASMYAQDYTFWKEDHLLPVKEKE